jgi:hypothetical protein
MASILELSKTRQFCLWWSEITMCVRASALHSKAYPGINSCISSFFQLAIRFDFVAYAVMGHSAGRLALVTKISSAFEDATRYRTLALQGLNAAITSFAKDNADAILCASLCLSNQEHDWSVHSKHLGASRMANKVSFQRRSWKAIMEGTSAVRSKLLQKMIYRLVFH